jgi:phage protein D
VFAPCPESLGGCKLQLHQAAERCKAAHAAWEAQNALEEARRAEQAAATAAAAAARRLREARAEVTYLQTQGCTHTRTQKGVGMRGREEGLNSLPRDIVQQQVGTMGWGTQHVGADGTEGRQGITKMWDSEDLHAHVTWFNK